MSNKNNDTEKRLNSLLPYGETMRPLVKSSSLTDSDLKFLLQKRGVFKQNTAKNETLPLILTLLLSPKEFEILKNRQHIKESNVKHHSTQAEWIGGDKSLASVFIDDNDLKNVIEQQLVGDNKSYEVTKCLISPAHSNKIVITGEIKRTDWTKDAFSDTTNHEWRLVIEKLENTNFIEYRYETTAPETRELVVKIEEFIHNDLQKNKMVKADIPAQKILANYFLTKKSLFDYLFAFTKEKYEALSYKRIANILSGVDNTKKFPAKFDWLNKGNVDEISLHGKKLDENEIISLGNEGILIFGEIEAEFEFTYKQAKGICVISYGFPKYYKQQARLIEFEAKITQLSLNSDSAHISKDNIKRYLLSEFQKMKHPLFQKLKDQKLVSLTAQNQIFFDNEDKYD